MVAVTNAVSLPGDPVLTDRAAGNLDQEGEPVSDGTVPPPAADMPDPDPWDGVSRVNVLVLGLDLRDGESEDAAPRSDTMIPAFDGPAQKHCRSDCHSPGYVGARAGVWLLQDQHGFPFWRAL